MGLRNIILPPFSIAENDNFHDINYRNIKKASFVLTAIKHEQRHELMKIIHENKKYTVTELYIKMGMEQSVISQHLAILRKAGIISSNREGKYIFYSINSERIAEINRFAEEIF